jgi:hypothetical protein
VEDPSGIPLYVRLLALPADVTPSSKHSSLLGPFVSYKVKSVVKMTPGPNVIKLFYHFNFHHSMVIPSFCVLKQHFLGNYCRMAVIYHRICVTNVIKHNLT